MVFFSKLFGKGEGKSSLDAVKGKLAFMQVDMHNHLLPGIDDGSESAAQSLKLISGLNEMGLYNFICTPHIMQGVHDNNNISISGAHETLSQALQSSGNVTKVYKAAEHMIDDGLQGIIQRDQLMVMPGGYVLIEMSYLSESKALFHTILDIQQKGYQPILAHPERYNYFHSNSEIFKQIKSAGCLLQLNLLSLSRYYGDGVNAKAIELAKAGMYDFVGTDIHHDRHLSALQSLVSKYPIEDILKTCSIQNESLLDHIN